ncbi:bifunctional copper resistance protein CopD/cytochrome c oxidase assembly protein [Frankia tisae]|nr:bifunctional copper resistance protein CopD/cytochrome c oxidase assembly protein [Frankia tisae]
MGTPTSAGSPGSPEVLPSGGVSPAPTSARPTSARPPGAAARALPVAVLAGCAVLALVVGFGPGPLRLPGLPSAGEGTYWALPFARLVGRIASVATLGWLLAAAVLLPSQRTSARHHREPPDADAAAAHAGDSATAHAGALPDRAAGSRQRPLTSTSRRCGRYAADAAVVWVLATLAELVFTLSDVSAQPAGDVLDLHALRSFVASTEQGRALITVAVLAAVVAIVGRTVTTTTAAGALLAVAAIALLPPVFAGHAASSGDHAIAVVALAVHILAASAWVGGLLGLLSAVRLPAGSFGPALRRHSRFAAGAALVTAVSGIGGAALRLGGFSPLWETRYGLLVTLKAVGLIAAVVLGGLLRRQVVARLTAAATAAGATAAAGAAGAVGRFIRLAGVELTVLTATLGLAVGLSRTAPPVNDALVPADPTRAMLGYPMPPPVTAVRLAADWRIDWVFLAASVVAAGMYLAGVRRLHVRGIRWPVGRTIAWLCGLAVVVIATSSGLGRYGPVLLSVHMTQHMLLSMLAPIPLVLGAPATLALRAMRPARAPHRSGPREWLVALLRSWPVRVLTHPALVTVNFIGSLYVLYLTSLLPTLMRNHLGHLYMNVHFLAVGVLFFELLIGIDPLPRRLPHPGRILMLISAVPFHTFLGLAIMAESSLLGADWYGRLVRPWGVSALSDQRTAGAIVWSFGELPTFVVLIVLSFQWARLDERRTRNRERRIAAAGDVDAELDAYNAYLAGLADGPTHRRTAAATGPAVTTGVLTGSGPAGPPMPPMPRRAADDDIAFGGRASAGDDG